MLKLLFGTSGSGKTSALIEAIRNDIKNCRKCYLLVPEQQVYISERDLPLRLPKNAGLFFETVSFSRLAELAFLTYGGTCDVLPDQSAKSVLMWETLRELSPALKRYSGVKNDLSLVQKMLSEVAEFRNNGIDCDKLNEVREKMTADTSLSEKISELCMIEEAFRIRLETSFEEGASDQLLRLAELLSRENFFANSAIYIDSFTSFTVPEYKVLAQIFRQKVDVTAALCAEEINSGQIQFQTVLDTARQLTELAKLADCPVFTESLSQPTGKRPAVISYLSSNLWNFTFLKKDRPTFEKSEQNRVHLSAISNLYEECELTALRILELVQSGMRYGDIAVVFRNTDTYRGILDAALERYHIPYFLSENQNFSAKPLSRLILTSLRAVNRNYRQQDIITLLKTGLTECDFRDISMFEEYCRLWHINGSMFRREVWNMNPDGLTAERSPRAEIILEAANRVRQSVMTPLLTLEAELRAATSLTDRCRAVYGYMEQLCVGSRLSDLAEKELKLGQMREAEDNLRLYHYFADNLTGLSALLPESEVTNEEFESLLSLLFSTSDFGSVPNEQDCVMLGSADLLRVENVKAMFLLGLYEGEFPAAVSDHGLLTEQDKSALEELGLKIDARKKKYTSEEMLYVWRAISKPTEQLHLSYPVFHTDGSVHTPSIAFSRILYLLDREPDRPDFRGLSSDSAKYIEKCKDISRPSQKESLKKTLRLSQSSIRSFVLCPYQYHLTHTLRLRDEKSSELRSSDEGSFLHDLFHRFLQRSLNEDGTLSLPSPDKVTAIAEEIIEDYLAEICPEPLSETDLPTIHLYQRLRDFAIGMLYDILNEINGSLFVPTSFEQPIGGKDGLPEVKWSLPNGSDVSLSGIVDRIDRYSPKESDRTFVRIVDYKSGEHQFSKESLQTGEDIQLVLYMMAALASNPEHISPACAEFIYVKESKEVSQFLRSGIRLDDENIFKALSANPEPFKKMEILSEEEIRETIAQLKTTVSEIAVRILNGECQKTPSKTACKFCPAKNYCDVSIKEKR